LITIASEPVGPSGIHGDKQDIQAAVFLDSVVGDKKSPGHKGGDQKKENREKSRQRFFWGRFFSPRFLNLDFLSRGFKDRVISLFSSLPSSFFLGHD
jgi:hypothetical protein